MISKNNFIFLVFDIGLFQYYRIFFASELLLLDSDNLGFVSNSMENGWLYLFSSQEEFNSLISGHPIWVNARVSSSVNRSTT